jgi:SAM-dependent methyltransferase
MTNVRKDPHKIVKDFYDSYYEDTFNCGGLNGWGYRKTHKDLEMRAPQAEKILEIGAGNAQHLRYVERKFSEYIMVDLTDKPQVFEDERLRWVQGDIEQSQFTPNYFDRILSMCVFHHLDNPEKVMELIDIWLKPGGTFSLFLPMDPGLANRLNRHLLVIPRTRKLGFQDYEIVNALEHKNHFWGLKSMLNYYFHHYDKKVVHRPFGKLIPFGNLYSIWQLRKPML